ncbi:MAG: hypothetical protein KDN22_24715 [Verrucomicrobiae bacterium]|nr:hypothetical protein [Verrucomicrobiae bacterium]
MTANYRKIALVLVVIALTIVLFTILNRKGVRNTSSIRESSPIFPTVSTPANLVKQPERLQPLNGAPSSFFSPTFFPVGGIFGEDGELTYAGLEKFGMPINRAKELQELIISYREKVAVEAREHTREIEYLPIEDIIDDPPGIDGPQSRVWMKDTDVVFEIAPFDTSKLLADFSIELDNLFGNEIADRLLPQVSGSPPFSTLGRYQIILGMTDHESIRGIRTQVKWELRPAADGGLGGGWGRMSYGDNFIQKFGNVFVVNDDSEGGPRTMPRLLLEYPGLELPGEANAVSESE